MELVIVRPDVNRAVGTDGGRRENQAGRWKLPPLRALRIERIKISVVRTKINHAILTDGWGGLEG